MGSWFSKEKKSKVTAQDRAVLQLKQQKDKLKQYQKKITINLEKDRLLAKSLLADGKKERAILLLKKKRYQEQLISKTDGQLDNIEQMIHDIEFAQIQEKVLEKLNVGNEALKKMHELFTIEDVERIMDETQEGIEKQQEIDSLLSGCLTDEDNEAVEEELAQIIKETLPEIPMVEEQALPELPSIEESLPEIPNEEVGDHEIKTKVKGESKLQKKVLVMEAS